MPRHRTALHLGVLTLACAVAYALFPTSHGLTNWQEAKRALVAREMDRRLETDPWAWLVPTDSGRPYLAKPPLMYWAQLAIARLRGSTAGELDLRLTVAVAGWLGVLATYGMGRSMLRSGDGGADDGRAPSRAFWGALFLATGILYTPSSRIGELDILLVAPTAGAAWAVASARRRPRLGGTAPVAQVAIGASCAVLAALTKGPPALLAVACAAYGGPLATAVRAGAASRSRRIAHVLTLTMGVAFGIGAWRNAGGLGDVPGVAIIAGCGAIVGAGLGCLVSPPGLRSLWGEMSRTHPVVVLGAGGAALWGWWLAVGWRVGHGTTGASAAEEAEDNLRLFVPDAPITNLEALAYGGAIASVACLAAITWIALRRPRLPLGGAALVAWLLLGFAAFSTLGKGVPRYLTPLWPAVALLGAWWFDALVSESRRPRLWTGIAGACAAALAIGQGAWYGVERERRYPDRSPRSLVRELAARTEPPSMPPLATFEFSTPAIDYYAGAQVESFHDVVPRAGLRMVGPRTLADLRREMNESPGERLLLVRATQPPGQVPEGAAERLRAAGFEFREITTRSTLTIDNGRSRVLVLAVR